MKLSLEALTLLDAIERHGSYGAAAAALHRVPSTLTHAVQRLEAQLEIDLFDKAARRVTLTAAGRALLADGRLLLRAAADLEKRVCRIANGWEAELCLAVDAVIPAARILPLIERFYAAGHSTEIRIVTEVLGGTWDALTTQRADLLIGAPGEAPARAGIVTQALGQAQLVFAVAPQHPLAAWSGPIPQAELMQYRAIVIADTSRELVKRSIGLLDGQPVLRVPDMESKAAAQAAGLGIGNLPRWLAAREVAAGRLVVRELAAQRPAVLLSTAWRVDEEGLALRWFVEQLAQAEVKAALLEGLD